MAFTDQTIQGEVAPGFEAVATAFMDNFSTRGELGAAFAVWRGDELLVDLWGGVRDPRTGAPWERDTLQLVYSGTKGLTSVCLLLLIDRGLLDLDAPVARYWPEFAAAGKGDILVRHAVTHQAGLPGLREPLVGDDLLDDRAMAARIAAETPFWPVGEQVCYHPMTWGWICGELIRRIDGRSAGRFFADEIAAPLGLDAWIGLPPELEERVSVIRPGPGWGVAPELSEERATADPVIRAVWHNPPGRHREPLAQNTAAYHQAEIPAANAIVSARSMARLYGLLATGGGGLLSPETLALGHRCLVTGRDPLIERPWAYGVGFQLQTELMVLGPPGTAFGHAGVGGSVHGAWPDQGLGFSYAMNELRSAPDFRASACLDALYAATLA